MAWTDVIEATRCGRRQQMSLNYWHEVAGPFGVD